MAKVLLLIAGWSPPGHIVVSAGVVMSPALTSSGTKTVRVAVPEQPDALVAIIVMVEVPVINVVLKTRPAPF